MRYLIATSDDLNCWIDERFYYITAKGFEGPSFQKSHTYDTPIRHLPLGELEDDGLFLIHEFLNSRVSL